ncbi:MAG: hypothetical protein WEA09_06885 [Gemmatimonadota bacterium]
MIFPRERSTIRPTFLALLSMTFLGACGDGDGGTAPADGLDPGTAEITVTGEVAYSGRAEAFYGSSLDPDGSGLYVHIVVLAPTEGEGGFFYFVNASASEDFPSGNFQFFDASQDDLDDDGLAAFQDRFAFIYFSSGQGGIPVVALSNSGTLSLQTSSGSVAGEFQATASGQRFSPETGEVEEITLQADGSFNAEGGEVNFPLGGGF